MKLNIFYGNTGTGKSCEILNEVKANNAAGKKSLVIVPGQFTFEYEKLLYNTMGAREYNSGLTDVLSFERIQKRIFESFPPASEAADMSAKLALLSMVIDSIAAKEGFACFKRQAGKPGFVNTCMGYIRELIHSRISPGETAELAASAANESFGAKFADIALIYAEYTKRFDELGLRDSDFDLTLAAEKAEKSGFFKDTFVYIDDFKSFKGDQYAFIREIVRLSEGVTVSLTIPDENKAPRVYASVGSTMMILSDRSRYDYPVEITKRKFTEVRRSPSPALRLICSDMFTLPPKVYTEDTSAVRIVSADNIYMECEFICSEIRRLTDEGMRFSDIAVLSRNMNDDVSVLSMYLDRYGIEYYSDKKHTLINTRLFRAVIYSLSLCTAYDTQYILSYAKTGLSGLDSEETAALENYAFMWDIEGNVWDTCFPDEEAEELRMRLLSPIKQLRRKAVNKTGREIAEAVSEHFEFLAQNSGLLSDGENDGLSADTAKQQSLDSQAADSIHEILASLSAVLNGPMTVQGFERLFTLCARRAVLSFIPSSLDSVMVMQSQLARLAAPKAVFIMRANDGVFPKTGAKETPFTDAEREFMRSNSCETYNSAKALTAEERFGAYYAMCAPTERLYMSYSKENDGNPSPYITRLHKIFPTLKEEHFNADNIEMLCRTEEAAYSAAVTSGIRTTAGRTIRQVLSGKQGYREKFDYLDSMSRGYNKAHSLQSTKTAEGLFGDRLHVSSTSFEEYSKCPFRFFAGYGLKLTKPVQNKLNAIYWGNTVHYCMEQFLKRYSKNRLIGVSDEEIDTVSAEIIDEYLNDVFKNGFAQGAQFTLFTRRLKANTARVLKRIRDEMKGSEFTPALFEYKIGGANSPLSVSADGHSLIFTGKLDRADTYKNMYVRVIDYKTGAKKFDPEQPLNGINLQMFLYLYELTREGGKFAGYKPAGVLYMPVVFPESADGREAGEEQIQKKTDDSLKMNGLILDDKDIISAMEKIDSGSGRFIPIKIKTDGTPYDISQKSLTDEAGFEAIKENALEQLKQMCEKLYNGEIPCSPLEIKGSQQTVCDTCDYNIYCVNYEYEYIMREWKTDSEQ